MDGRPRAGDVEQTQRQRRDGGRRVSPPRGGRGRCRRGIAETAWTAQRTIFHHVYGITLSGGATTGLGVSAISSYFRPAESARSTLVARFLFFPPGVGEHNRTLLVAQNTRS